MNRIKITANLLLTITVVCTAYRSHSQVSIRDSAISMHVIGFNYSFNIPFKDMAVRFGNSSQLSVSYLFKTTANFYISPYFAYFFSGKVNDSFVLDAIKTGDGYLINNQGTLCPVAIEQRGFHSGIQLGYLYSFNQPNLNSGIVFSAGPVFLQHKLSFDYSNGPVNQIEGEYRKGYDRLTNGIGLIQTIGFQRFGNKGLGNYHFSIYMVEAFTQSRRDFDFYLQKKDDLKRKDFLLGFQLGFDIPIYRKTSPEFYIK
ncbi:MAG TPA: hypothetical protein P5265_07760 [Bacteroidia bacterium]|nr:hypothetical protein [Bacteroidia bacterium]